MFSRGTVSVHPEDDKILAIVRELLDQINYHRFDFRAINWWNRIGVRRFPPDAVFINPYTRGLVLSTYAMGRLTPEEWRPILASGLLFYKNRTRGMLKAIAPIMSVVLLAPFILFASFRLLGNSGQLAYLRGGVLVLFFIFIGATFFLFLHFQKSVYLNADDNAAQLVGKTTLLASLTKLASIDQGAGKMGFLRPSIQERIYHLSAESWGQFRMSLC